MAEEDKKATPKRASDKSSEPSSIESPLRKEGLFKSDKALREAEKMVGDRTVSWAHRDGEHVRFFTWPDGQTLLVRDA